MVVDEHEEILVSAMLCADKRAGNVGVDQSAGVSERLGRIGFGTSGAAVESTRGERRRGIGGDFGKPTQTRRPNVQTSVEADGSVAR
eukprot:247618-Pleurochrysis_carterae.AAC.1